MQVNNFLYTVLFATGFLQKEQRLKDLLNREFE